MIFQLSMKVLQRIRRMPGRMSRYLKAEKKTFCIARAASVWPNDVTERLRHDES